MGNYEIGRLLYESALLLTEEDEKGPIRAFLFEHMGELETHYGNHNQARKYLQIAISLYEQTGGDLGKANTLLHLAALEIKEKNAKNAKSALQEAMRLYKKILDKVGEYNSHLYNAKLILRLEQDPEEAISLLQKVGMGFEAIEGREGVAEVGFFRAEAYHQMQQPEEALKQYQEAFALAKELDIAQLNVLAKEIATIIGVAGIEEQASIA